MAHISPMSTEITHEHKNYTPQRRRQLFPTNDEDSDDLGHMSPLSDSTRSDSPVNSLQSIKYTTSEQNVANFSKSTIADYVILENITDTERNHSKISEQEIDRNLAESEAAFDNKFNYQNSEKSMSPLHLSPEQCPLESPVISSPKKNKSKNSNINGVCLRKSPSVTLKTPQATSNVNTAVPKLIRKSPLDACLINLEQGKRKIPLSVSPPTNKHIKLDQGAKVRTVLFPKSEASVPTASFYSKTSDSSPGHVFKKTSAKTKTTKPKASSLFLCGRRGNRKRSGQINAGVRHKIRKPKQKKIIQSQLLKAALNIIDYSPLNDYLMKIYSNRKASKDQERDPLLDDSASSPAPDAEDVQKRVQSEAIEENIYNEIMGNKKRELTPPPDPSKKFFKFKRNHNATITVDKHLKLRVGDGKLTLLESCKQNKKFRSAELKVSFDVADLIVPENENLLPHTQIDDILCSLESDSDDNNKENNTNLVQMEKQALKNSNQLVLKAHNSVTMSENAIHLHMFEDNESTTNDSLSLNCSLPSKTLDENSILLSPTSLMCNMTSGLALNSPKKAQQNINDVLNNCGTNTTNSFNEISCASDMEQEKLFPIFYGANKVPSKNIKAVKNTQHVAKKFKALPKDQMLLDAGQKRFGVTQCTECQFVYHMGDPNDELLHLNYHNAGNILRFSGWKDEHVLAQLTKNDRIIRVLPSDPKPWGRKVKDLLEVVNRDLGFYEMPVTLNNTQVYLYIKNKTIAGCLVAEPKSSAYRLLSDDTGIDLCSERSYPVKCGVSRIWVSQSYRKEGVGTALLNSLRANFMYGSILAKDDVAFSSPTEAGKAFASKYFNTPNFLIYTS